MSAPSKIIPGSYHLQFGLSFPPGANSIPPPEPLYLTNNGEGKQLTVLHPTGLPNQVWKIEPPLTGHNDDLVDRIIIPAISKDVVAVSQSVVRFPDHVSLIKNLQVWTFQLVRESDKLYEIWSNLYPGLAGSAPLLGVDKEFKNVVIDFVPVIEHPPPRPVWQLIGPLPVKK